MVIIGRGQVFSAYEDNTDNSRFVNSTIRNELKLECGPMSNVMAALPNVGGALC